MGSLNLIKKSFTEGHVDSRKNEKLEAIQFYLIVPFVSGPILRMPD